MSPAGADTSPAGAVEPRPDARGPSGLDRRVALAVLAGVAALVALVLASVGLADASLWLDETFSVFDARRDPADILAMRGEAYGGAHHPPGYFLLLKGTIAICGVNEVCVRAPSVVANAAIAAMLVVLGQRLFGWIPAATAGLLWATLPYAVKYGQQARHYTLLAFVAALALWLIAPALGERGDGVRARASDRTFVALGLVTSSALWLHLFALPFLGALGLVTLVAVLVSRDRATLPTPRQWAMAAGVAVVASAPLLPGMWRVWITGGGGQLESKVGPIENARELLVDLGTFGLDTPWIPAVCACALLRPSWRARGLVVALALLAVLPLVVVFVRNPEHFVALRYFMPSLVPVALLFGAGVGGIVGSVTIVVRRFAPRVAGWLAPSIAVAVLALPAVRLGELQIAGLRKQWATAGYEPWRDVAVAIRSAAADGDVAVYVPFELVQYPMLVYEVPTPAFAPDELSDVLRDHPPGVFVVASHVERPDRVAARRATLRALATAGYVRADLDGVPRQPAIEVMLYRPRRPR